MTTDATPEGLRAGPIVGPGRPGRRRIRRDATRLSVRVLVLAYLAMLLAAPVATVFLRAFDGGIDGFVAAISTPNALHALRLTLIATVVAVIANTVFGVACAMLIVRQRPRGTTLLNAFLDLPFAVSPVVVGLALILAFGVDGWFGGALAQLGVQVIFSTTGIVLATVFVTVPFVVREVVPVLVEVGDEQEQAAATLGAGALTTFRRVTLPSIKWGVGYGVVLTAARALGEYGAVAVVSGRVSGRTETMTVYIEERYQSFDLVATYAASVVLAICALLVLGAMTSLSSRKGDTGGH